MRQIKEKAPATPASVTSANINNQVKDTTKKAYPSSGMCK